MSVFGETANVLGLFQSDPTFRTLRNVKNPELGSRIDDSLAAYDTVKNSGNDALGDYITKYLAGTAAADSTSKQEIGNIDQYYNGSIDSQLAQLRAQRAKAVGDAATYGANVGLANSNRSLVGGDGSGGSYADRLRMGATQPYFVNAAVDNATQAKSDFDATNAARLALTGKRTQLADMNAGRALQPEQIRRNLFSQNLDYLKNIGEQDRGNTFYGLQQKTTDLDKWINHLNTSQANMDKDLGTAMQMYSTATGKGGGSAAPSSVTSGTSMNSAAMSGAGGFGDFGAM